MSSRAPRAAGAPDEHCLHAPTPPTAAGSADVAEQVARIYTETPRAVLYLGQVAEMLGVSNTICAEAMILLVRQRMLRCTGRGEYVLR
jgi:hypothetical protein